MERIKLFLFLLLCATVSGSGVSLNYTLYEIFPANNVQLFQLYQQAILNNEVIILNGVQESLNTLVQLLASTESFSDFDLSVLQPLNLTFTVVDAHVTINFSSSTVKQGKISSQIRVKKIPGTSLFTGIYYKLTNKRFPSSVFTYTTETNDYAANFLQLDMDPSQIPLYSKGQKWYNEDQWIFIEAPDSPGWYEIRNKVIPDGITTWSYSKVGGGYHIIVSRKVEDVRKLSAGEEWRVHALWRPVKMQEGFYKLVNKNYPTGTITWTERKYRNISHYIQVDVKPEHVGNYYEPGGKWYDDALFDFTPVTNLQATISSLKFTNPELLLNYTSRDHKLHLYTIYNPSDNNLTSSVTNSLNDDAIVLFNLRGNIGMFDELKLQVNIPELGLESFEITGLSWVPGRSTISTKINTGASRKVKVPPGGAVKFFADVKSFSNVNYPFNATLKVTGTAGDGVELTGDVIFELLKDEWKDYEVLTLNGNSVTLNISGELEGSFGYQVLSEENATNETERCGP